MSKYLIKLRPVESYFFGGENTFGEDRLVQNYYVKSNYYPQQTSLLGMLRFQLLKNNGLLPLHKNNNKDNAAKLIGEKSFDLQKAEQTFGAIKNISPLFLMEKDEKYYFSPKYEGVSLKEEKSGKSSLNDNRDFVPILDRYNVKNNYPELVKPTNGGKSKTFEQVFLPKEKVGITKGADGATEEGAFYRQVVYSLKKDWEFAFYAEIEDNAKFENDIITLGGENSKFRMEIKKATETYEKAFNIETGKNNIVILMSDAIVNEDIYEHCKFAITETADFRFIKTNTKNTKNFDDKPKKGNKMNLLKRGSILFPKDFAELEKCFQFGSYQDFGFNIFKTVKNL